MFGKPWMKKKLFSHPAAASGNQTLNSNDDVYRLTVYFVLKSFIGFSGRSNFATQGAIIILFQSVMLS
jgi:hypothetical protein